jgi:hypothetical protein
MSGPPSGPFDAVRVREELLENCNIPLLRAEKARTRNASWMLSWALDSCFFRRAAMIFGSLHCWPELLEVGELSYCSFSAGAALLPAMN